MCFNCFFKKRNAEPINKVIKIEKILGECPICFYDIISQNKNLALPCGHVFHDDCIAKWIKIHNFCPMCYYQL